MKPISLLVLCALFMAWAASGLNASIWLAQFPSSINDMAFQVTANYSMSDKPSEQMGVQVVLLTNGTNNTYISSGDQYIPLDSLNGTVLVTVKLPSNFYTIAPVGTVLQFWSTITPLNIMMYNNSLCSVYAIAATTNTSVSVARSREYGPKGKLRLMGVNLSGAEYAGVTYPYQSGSYFSKKGFNIFNLPTRWHKLQTSLSVAALDATELKALKTAVNHLTNELGALVAIQPHDYAKYNGKEVLGADIKPAVFAQFWTMVAGEFMDNPRVIFSLMNEPHDLPVQDWVDAALAAIKAIRDLGATNYITVQPARWASAGNFFTIEQWGLSNANVMTTVLDSDPLGKIFLNVHQYFDKSFGGSSPGCVSDGFGVELLSGLTLWLKQNNQTAYLGELGASVDSPCQANIQDVLNFLESNSDVWLGWSWWEAGPFNTNNFMSIEPNGADRTQLSWLTPHVSSQLCSASDASSTDAMLKSCSLLTDLPATTAPVQTKAAVNATLWGTVWALASLLLVVCTL